MNARIFFLLRLLTCLIFFFAHTAFAQRDVKTVDMKVIEWMKAEGRLPKDERFFNFGPHETFRVTPPNHNIINPTPSSCNCWLTRDTSWHICSFDGSGDNGGPGTAPLYRNDDWSTDTVTLPFNFCFYGNPLTKLFINNNGNVSFGSPYSTFTADSFPSPDFVMVAPFWGDVDTRNLLSGLVYYKLTPTYLAVQWDHVGYYNTHADKVNTFQLIMTDGLDPILPSGQNTSFCYQDMQWTTGNASGGVNGFGGEPATVGVNRGNLTDYIQLGRFDTAGTAFDGPFGNADGVSWLDNQSFYFNICFSGNNIAPIVNALRVCDTLQLCVGDTLLMPAKYFSPEQDQTTSAAFNGNTMTGASVLSNVPGNTANMMVQLIGLNADLGFQNITFSGTDNGVPPLTTTTNMVVHVVPSPTSGFTFTPASPLQAGTPMTFTNTSTPGMVYSWNFGDGSALSGNTNEAHVYNTAGLYTVSLSATNANGCTDVFKVQIQVNASAAVAVLSGGIVCDGTPLQISYAGSANPLSNFLWNFNGGTVVSGSGGGPYMVKWNTAGNKNVTLSVTDPLGCTAVAVPLPITVNANPIANIAATPVVCESQPDVFTFSGTAIAGATYNWSFGNATVLSGTGQGPYSLQWNSPGIDSTQLIVSQNGCSDTTEYHVLINAIPTSPFIALPAVCAGDLLPVTYTGSAVVSANYAWNFGGATVLSGSGQGPYSIRWNTPAPYILSLTVTQNGCVSPITNFPVTVNAVPVSAMTTTPSICLYDSNDVSFTGTSIAGATFTWNFGNASVISGSLQGPYRLKWNTAQSDTVHLIVSQNGCRDTALFPVLIKPIPTSPFIALPAVCAGDLLPVTYTGSAVASANYAWNFAGANVLFGSGQGPYSIRWNTPGPYILSLTVTQNGCVSPITNFPVTVNAVPVSAMTTTPIICLYDSNDVSFTGTSIAGATFTWNFGNASIVSGIGQGPYRLKWSIAQNDTINLIVSQNGCRDTTVFPVLIKPVPVSPFVLPPYVCIHRPAAITYLGSAPASATYSWSFDNARILSGSGSGQGPYSVVWDSAKSPLVSLIINQNGCISSLTNHSLIVSDIPPVNAGLDDTVCSGIIAHVGSVAQAGLTYQWSPTIDLSDSTASVTSIATTIRTTTLVRPYVLISKNIYGCINKDTVAVTINPTPIINFNDQTPQCFDGNRFTFVAGGNFVSGTQYHWNFGSFADPGSTSSQQNPPQVSYSSIGSFPVILNAAWNNCPAVPYVDTAIVYESPVADFRPSITEGCEPLAVQFSNRSTGVLNIYQWFFSDPPSDANVSPVHVFNHAGVYTVALRAITSEGCPADTFYTNLITVHPKPNAAFEPTPAVAPVWSSLINFDNTSSDAISYAWDFGDGSASSKETDPYHTYRDTGTYEITLYVTSAFGCLDTVKGLVRIENEFTFYIPNSFTPNSDGVNDSFQGYGTFIKSYTMYIFNRWGKIIYSTGDYNKPWNGKVDDPVQNDVYVYKILVTDMKDKPHEYIGHVTMIR